MPSACDDQSEVATLSTRPRISLCMVVADDLDALEDCLQSASPVVSDIVIVDTSSSHRVRDLAEAYHPLVIETLGKNNRSELRNITLEHARGDWVLVLDADEQLDPSSYDKILRATRYPYADAYALLFHNYVNSQSESPCFVHRTCRIFRNRSGYRFAGKVYERIVPSIEASGGSVAELSAVVHHYAYRSGPSNGAGRHDRYVESMRAALSQDPSCLGEIAVPGPQYSPSEDFEHSLALLKKLSELVTSPSPLTPRR